MNPSFLHSCLLLVCLVGFIVVVSAVSETEIPRSSVSHKPRLVNMSLLLHIPPKLQRRYKIPELVDTSLPQQQKEVAANLKKWAMDQLLCQGHAKNNDGCDDQNEAIESALLKENKNLDMNKIIKPNTYLCSPDSVHAWNILGAIFLHNNNKDVITFGGNAHLNKITCLGQALKCDPTYALAWFNIAHELRQAAPGVGVDLEFFDAAAADDGTGKMETSKVYSKHVTREDCLVQALVHAPWHSDAWFALGMSIKSSTNDTYVEVGPTQKKMTKRECYVQAIETTLDERSRSLFAYWNNLGNVLVDSNDNVNVKGKVYSKLDCYVKVVKLNPDFSIGWFNLGAAMDSAPAEGSNDVFVEIEEEKTTKQISKQQALLRALSSASNEHEENALKNNPIFWINLANSMRHGNGEVKLSFRFDHNNNPSKVLTKTFTAKDCYVKALELDGGSASAWNNLGTVLELSSSSTSGKTSNNNNNPNGFALFTPGPGYLRRDDENENKIKFSKIDCYVEAIRHSSDDFNYSNNKNDPSWSSSSFYVEALAWKNLGDILGLASLIDENGKVHTNVANMADLLLNREEEGEQNENKQSREDSASLSISSEFVEIGGKKYNKRRCFAEVIRILDSNFINNQKSESSSSTFNLSPPAAANTLSHSWTELGVIVYKESKMYRSVKVGSTKRFNAVDCFVRATQVDASNHRAWYNLGIVLGNSTLANIASSISKSEVVSSIHQLCGVGSSKTDKDNSVDKYFYRQCFVRSLAANPLHCSSWNALGNSLNRQDRLTTEPEDVVVFENGRIVKKRDAYLQAVQCGENFMKNEFTKDDALLQHVLSLSWFSLGTTLKNRKKDKIALQGDDGSHYTMQGCFVQAVQYDPTNADAWYNLGLSLELNEKVVIRPFLDVTRNNNNNNGERSGYEVDRKLCFESYDAIKNGGLVHDLLIESGVKITSLNEIGTTRRSVVSGENVIKLKKEEKFVVEEDDDDF